MLLGIYLVKEHMRSEDRGDVRCNDFDSFIVAAEDMETAKRYILDWWKTPEVVCIGEAADGVKEGIILGSWNSTG